MDSEQVLTEILELMRLDSDFPNHGCSFEPQMRRATITLVGTQERFKITVEDITENAEREYPYWYPKPGQVWHWEPMSSTATCRLKVVSIETNEDGEVWIGAVKANVLGWHDDVVYNELPRFMQACILLEPDD